MFEERLIFKPTRDVKTDPGKLGLPFREVWLQARDGVRLHAWLVPGGRPCAWVWYHGCDGNIGEKLEIARLVHGALGVSILIFDYRGYGRSEGRPSERGLCLDGAAAVQWVRREPELRELPLVLYGRSLGAAVAIETARREGCAGLIVESAFVSIQAMAAATVLGRVIGPLMSTRLNNLAKIGAVQAPVLVLHGDADEKVPVGHALRLFRAAPEPTELFLVSGASHDDIAERAGRPYLQALERLLRRAGVPEQAAAQAALHPA